MRRRRIFKPAREQRRMGRAFALLASLGMLAVLTAVLRPGNLLGSAPRTQDWRALPAEVRVLDGETLRLGDRVLRLYGVGAPARGQACGVVTDCGGMAANELARLVRDRAVECKIQGQDRFGRALGTCRAGGVELNASLVAAGWASADEVTMPALVPIEATARQARRGMWAQPTP
jgi:endonuclease YncB( thermonuclease family)